jgi:hypothetical protein
VRVVVLADGTVNLWQPLTGASISGNTNSQLTLEGVSFDTASVAAYATGTLGVPTVTALPSSPTDGQEIYYRFQQTVNPADAAWIIWHLRYDSAAAAWLPVGEQAPLIGVDPFSRGNSFSANAWGTIHASDPTVTLPRAGDYRLAWGMASSLASQVINQWVGLQIAGVDPAVNGAWCASGHGAPSTWEPGPRGEATATGLAVNTLLRIRFYAQTTAATLTRAGPYVMAWPRRITG